VTGSRGKFARCWRGRSLSYRCSYSLILFYPYVEWKCNTINGQIVVGGNGEAEQSNQCHGPRGLSFDRQGNLYVVDCWNHRVQKFVELNETYIDNHFIN
jgi:hypothetical protein